MAPFEDRKPTAADGLSSSTHVVELADRLTAVADCLHARIMDEIRGYDGAAVPHHVQRTMRALQDDETLLRQRANALHADAATHIVEGLGQPQARLVALTADAAEKIRRIAVIGEVTSIVGGVLALAGAIASGQATPIVAALEKIHRHASALDALPPPPAKPAA